MMMECPRCGFTQPKDQFCASCGLNVDQYAAKPKPLLVRLLQNPNLHLSLIGVAVVFVIGYIIYSQSTIVSQQIGNLLDLPLSSRDAADPNDLGPARQPREVRSAATTQSGNEVADAPSANTLAATTVAVDKDEGADSAPPKNAIPADAVKLGSTNKLEVSHWEVPREALSNLIALAEKIGESTGGRAYLYPTGTKIFEEIQSVGRRVTLGRNIPTAVNGQMTMETPPTTTEAFQFGLFFHINKVENKELGLRWESSLVLPQPETPQEAASGAPAVRATVEAALNGQATFTSSGLLLIVIEPPNRSPREEFLARAGEGPWTIFTSPEFRSNLTDWVISVQIK